MTHEAAEIAKLAERVEACREGGEFALDVDIRSTLGLPLIGSPKSYTASLDAAMSLVPEGWRIWTADFSVEGRFVWMLCGPKLTWITHEDGSREGGDDWYQSGIAASPALALTAAALRARAIQSEKGEQK